MDDFSKYEQLRGGGLGPGQVYSIAKVDGLDEITSIRLLRRVFDLSLADAKRVIGAGDWFEARQPVRVGARVYWEDLDSIGGPFLMEASVSEIRGDLALLQDLRKFRLIEDELAEVPLDGSEPRELSASYLERSLAERLEGWEPQVKSLIEMAR